MHFALAQQPEQTSGEGGVFLAWQRQGLIVGGGGREHIAAFYYELAEHLGAEGQGVRCHAAGVAAVEDDHPRLPLSPVPENSLAQQLICERIELGIAFFAIR